jgi:hypothetical protein
MEFGHFKTLIVVLDIFSLFGTLGGLSCYNVPNGLENTLILENSNKINFYLNNE